MKNATGFTKTLTALLKKLPAASPPDLPEADNPVAVLIQSYLLWDATTAKADVAYRKIRETVVDFNDLRVSMPHETLELIGTRYVLGLDRCERLRASLRDIYMREHDVSLDGLKGKGKRDIKKYIDSLDGITPYVAARVQLLSFETHGIPVDSQLRRKLIDSGAAEEDVDINELSNWMARQIRAEDGLNVHYVLQAWIDKGGKSSTASGETPKITAKTTASGTGTKKRSSKKSAVKSAK